MRRRTGVSLAPCAAKRSSAASRAWDWQARGHPARQAAASDRGLTGDATTPSAARLNLVREKIARPGPRCAFPEHAHDPRLIATAIEGTDAATGATLNPGPDLYRDTRQALADALTDCLSRS
ncbi:hypothetical protein L1965_02240 [Paracoccus sp. EGI L200073]|nr:hypothetical protein [Paracoccus salsus]